MKGKKQRMKRAVCLGLAVCLILATLAAAVIPAFAAAGSADFALNTPVSKTYTGSREGRAAIDVTNFSDSPDNEITREAIARAAALNVIKGTNITYRPNSVLTNEDALSLVLMLCGLENDVLLCAQDPKHSHPHTISEGIWHYALTSQLITAEVYNERDDPNAWLYRNAGMERQVFAQLLYTGITNIIAAQFPSPRALWAIYKYVDYNQIDTEYYAAVDALSLNGAFEGVLTSPIPMFEPTSRFTRGQAAEIVRNLEDIYLPMKGLERKNGTVVDIKDEQVTATGTGGVVRSVYIRTAAGTLEVIEYEMNADSRNTLTDKDAPVYKGGKISGLASLAVGDTIEYIYQNASGIITYVDASKTVRISEIKGLLNALDAETYTITLADAAGKKYNYFLSNRLIGKANNEWTLLISGKRQKFSTMPYGSIVKLRLVDGFVSEVAYVGDPVIISEMRGIVTENDVNFGTLSIIDNSGTRHVFKYFEDDMKVQKIRHFDTDLGDDFGYITSVFPKFKYDKRDAEIWEIEAGDIVFIRFDKDDEETITSISAATNYSLRYGKVKELVSNADYSSILVEYENGRTAWFDFANDIFITKNGKPVNILTLIPGDWVRLLTNEAIIESGYVIETLKEIAVEGQSHLITTLIKGNLSNLDAIQNSLSIQNSQQLLKTGWTNYKNLEKYNLGRDVEYYNGNTRISLEYAVKYFKRSDATVYIALENNYSGIKVKKVTFRNERDELLAPDTVVASNGNGSFQIFGVTGGNVATDAGTIVRRFGRLVDGKDILPTDYVTVSLNGNGKAAVVDIADPPGTNELQIVRGRVTSVDEGKSFSVQSMSMLSGMNWVYSPILREFTIDYNTVLMSENGRENMDNFLDYTDDNVINKVYNIVVEGGMAKYVIDAPYSTLAVRGTIYDAQNGTISIKNATYYDGIRWLPVSSSNATVNITTAANTLFGKNNKVIDETALVKGDQIIAYTPVLPAIGGGMGVDGYIVLVEK